MKVISRYLSFVIPLSAMLLSYTMYLTLYKVVDNYKKSIVSDYAIVVVSHESIDEDAIDKLDIGMRTFQELDKDKIIENLKDSLSDNSVELLNKELPNFYQLKLVDYPSTAMLVAITTKLKTISSIIEVEVFAKDHNQQYFMFLMLYDIINIFFFVIVLFSFLTLLKHIKIWFYENKNRIYIMQLHGASLFYCSKPIILTALFSAIYSSVIAIFIIYYILNNLSLFVSKELMKYNYIQVEFNSDYFSIFALSFFISTVTVLMVLIKQKYEK